MLIDGTARFVGGQSSGTMYSTYQPTVAARLAVSSPVALTATYKIRGDQCLVSLDATATAAISTGNVVYFLVCLDDFHSHPNFVVATLDSEPFTPTSAGQTQHIERTFTLNPSWDRAKLRPIMIVQNGGNQTMVQAAVATPSYEATVTLDCEPDGVQAGWQLTGPYETRSGTGDASFQLFDAGAYTVTWDASPYWTGPAAPQGQSIPVGGTATFQGVYSDGPFAPVTAGALGTIGAARAGTLVDFDEDGDLDIHLVRYGEADQLLRNDGALGFTSAATGAIADAGSGTGAAWADLTGDGHLDVYVTRANQANLLLRGDGTGTFTPVTAYGAGTVGPAEGANFVDFNLDGKLDLYIYQNNPIGSVNQLLLGFGDIGGGTYLFSGQSNSLSLDGNASTCAWTDADLDGRLDPFVVRRYGGNQLFQNLSFGFTDRTPGSGLTESGNESAAAWGDFDNDGDFDLYLASDGGVDKLFRCVGPYQFEYVTGSGLGTIGTSRGVNWIDLDNDTHLDLYVARYGQPDLVLMGDGDGAFTRVMPGVTESEAGSMGVAAADLDGDGRPDLFVPRAGYPSVVMKSRLGAGNHWFKLDLSGGGTNRAAIGARVVLTAGGVAQSRLLTSGGASAAPLQQHFGLGTATGIDQIDIYWPSGLHQVVTPKPADITLHVIEGQTPVVSGVPGELPAIATALGGARPNPFNPSTTIAFRLGAADHATLAVYTVDGRLVRTLLDESLAAGDHAARWDGRDDDGRAVSSGTYLYRLTADGGFVDSGRMTLIK